MNILICDDSGMARKQMLRALPASLGGDVHFAANGQEALEILESGPIDLLLLDLTMPVMDGYETLYHIQARKIECMTIVVSGDIQPEAQERVLSLGALAFQKKPVNAEEMENLLTQYGMLSDSGEAINKADLAQSPAVTQVAPEDSLREVANVAMGQAADKLARVLNSFINLPIPRVAVLSRGELAMTLESLIDGKHIAVSQGFVGRGLAAEALLSTDLRGRAGLEKLLGEHQAYDDSGKGSVLDAAAVLTGAFITGIGNILDLDFSRSQPVLLSPAQVQSEEWQQRINDTDDTLTIEIPYHFEKEDFICDLMLLFPKQAGELALERSNYLMEESV